MEIKRRVYNSMKKNTKMLALSAMFVALIAVFAQISFPIPGTPIVFTMGIMGVMLTGLMLPWGYAFLALIVYLLLGRLVCVHHHRLTVLNDSLAVAVHYLIQTVVLRRERQ